MNSCAKRLGQCPLPLRNRAGPPAIPQAGPTEPEDPPPVLNLLLFTDMTIRNAEEGAKLALRLIDVKDSSNTHNFRVSEIPTMVNINKS